MRSGEIQYRTQRFCHGKTVALFYFKLAQRRFMQCEVLGWDLTKTDGHCQVNLCRQQISKVIECGRCLVRKDRFLPAPHPPTNQILVRSDWKPAETINSVIDTNPIALLYMEMLMGIVVS